MSGGTFDYNQHQIRYIIEEIETYIERQGKLKDDINDIYRCDFYAEYPESRFYETYTPEVQEAMKAGIKALKVAEVYAHRIDYFLAGDDGEESFLRRLKEDLSKL